MEPHGHVIDEVDAPFIDLESEREMQAYNLMKEHEFLHSSAFDPTFLHQIGMDVEFDTIFEHLGWSRVAPVHELGSRLLTIQILGTLQIVDYGITFRCFGRDFGIYWKDLANRLGFHERCSIDLGFSLGGYQRHAFWHLISGQHVIGKFQGHSANIHHPTLRLLHKWIASSFFSRDDTHLTYDIELKLLYAALKKIKVAPIIKLVNHWLHSIKTSTAIMCTSLITRLAASVDPHAANTIIYITTPRIMINESHLSHAHMIKRDETG